MFTAFRKEFGFRLRDLVKIHGAGVRKKNEDGGRTEVLTTVFHSSKKIELPPLGENRSTYQKRKKLRVSGFDVVQEGLDKDDADDMWGGMFPPKLFVVTRPKTLVFGDKGFLTGILGGKVRGGVPHPELMAVTAGKKPLAYFAVRMNPDGENEPGQHPFKPEWLDEKDPMTFVMGRLQVEPKTEHSVLSLRVRFKKGDKGPEKLREGLDAFLKETAKDKRFAMFAEVLGRSR